MAVDINIHYTDPTSDARKQPFTLVPGETNTSVTSLTLLGQGTPNYSTVISQNFLHILENFASATPPSNGTIGQMWYNSTAKEMRMLTAITGGTTGARQETWAPVGANIVTSATAPTDLTRLWYDTSDALASNHQLKIYNTTASAWQPVTKQWLVVGTTAPTNTTVLWYNTSSSNATNHELYVYDTSTSAWRTVVSHNASLLTGSVPDSVLTTSNIGGNAATATTAVSATSATTATKLATARTISISGAGTASASFDGSAAITLNLATINASVLTGTVPVTSLGDSGTRAAGYYLAGNNVWTALPAVPDSYTKTQTDTLLALRPLADSITYVGLASGLAANPYMRKSSDSSIVYLQPKLTYTPAPVASTLAGYGITDAYTMAQVNALIPPAGVLAPNGTNFIAVAQNSTSYTIPAGGTWCYSIMSWWKSGQGNIYACGVAAGGTTITFNANSYTIYGWCWRFSN